MQVTLPAIYPITDSWISELSHYEQVVRLIDGGATLIQLREKRASPAEWFQDARRAIAAARDHGVRIIINDRVDIALALGADGVHLGQDDLPPIQARALLGNDAIIGYSTHSLEQVHLAMGLPVDYLAFGPIFGTTTKEDPDATVGLEMLEQVSRSKANLPLVAIGGILASNLGQVLAAGADSAAMIGSILSEPTLIARRMQELMGIAGQ